MTGWDGQADAGQRVKNVDLPRTGKPERGREFKASGLGRSRAEKRRCRPGALTPPGRVGNGSSLRASERPLRASGFYQKRLQASARAMKQRREKTALSSRGEIVRRIWMPRSSRACRRESKLYPRVTWNHFFFRRRLRSWAASSFAPLRGSRHSSASVLGPQPLPRYHRIRRRPPVPRP